MREQFEKLPEIKSLLYWDGYGFNEEINQYFHPDIQNHRIGCAYLMGGWMVWQHCQQDYKHLLSKYRATKKLQYSTSEHNSKLHMTLQFVKDHFVMNDLGDAMPRVYEKIVECLEDQPRKVHNTSCTYQFELAFLNLQDTPELRKLYWSALGQLQFDDNDQVVTPELEQCVCCKENQI